MKAIWNDRVIAESNDIKKIEGNNYFSLASIKKKYLKKAINNRDVPRKGFR